MFFKYIKLVLKLYLCDNIKEERKLLDLYIPNNLTEKRVRKRLQTTCIYCEICGLELTSGSWIGEFKENEHSYCCMNCAKTVTYKFGIAPVAIKWKNNVH